jgi:hypothetical protein
MNGVEMLLSSLIGIDTQTLKDGAIKMQQLLSGLVARYDSDSMEIKQRLAAIEQELKIGKATESYDQNVTRLSVGGR